MARGRRTVPKTSKLTNYVRFVKITLPGAVPTARAERRRQLHVRLGF